MVNKVRLIFFVVNSSNLFKIESPSRSKSEKYAEILEGALAGLLRTAPGSLRIAKDLGNN
jgi:hypothetical protein